MSERETEETFPDVGTDRHRIREQMLHIADLLGRVGFGGHSHALVRLAKGLDTPLRGILSDLEHPSVWVTRDLAVDLAHRLMEGAALIAELMRDAEITGSQDVHERARGFLADLGLLDDERTDDEPNEPASPPPPKDEDP